MSRNRLLASASVVALGLVAAGGAVAQDLKPTSGETVFFRGWQYKTDIVQSNVDRYNSELDGKVDYATVTGDYPAIMETNLIAGAELDILYANPSQAARYYDGGWVLPAESLPNIDEIKADMYPNILDAWTYKGELTGLSYFVSTRGVMHVNLKQYGELGYTDADFPATWDELYDQLYEIRDKGVEQPYLPHWLSEWYGISWGFVFEVMNRGGDFADPETHQPTLDTSEGGPAWATLEDWKRIFNDGLVPEEVLTYNESAYIDAYASGRYVFSPQQLYDLETFNRPDRSQIAGEASLLPYQGQSWGLLDSAVYLMTSRERDEAHTDDVKKFASWYGFKDQNGEIFVGQRWMQESMLFSGYKSVMESEATAERMKGALARPGDVEAVLGVYAETPYPKGIWNVVWSEEFNSWLREELQAFILDDGDIGDMLESINEKITELNAKYGI
ncbi:MAG: extracellular solute-binding protein [Geminicoccaceae bacterium]|jgi:multiple sugar transport system substrate-binding protein|nr:extracellular solute-binding protein [Geminicoccaceae bacterium]MCB9966031.1 extracellular solute-binding protein [Geminicoccaceae bacterium]HRY24584.1 extracellular solute-binding protein [Geminicoccaceae bacterium]